MGQKQRSTGYVARCQCGVYVGALDANNTEQKDMGRMLGKWLFDGCTVEPRFEGIWTADIKPCQCNGQ